MKQYKLVLTSDNVYSPIVRIGTMRELFGYIIDLLANEIKQCSKNVHISIKEIPVYTAAKIYYTTTTTGADVWYVLGTGRYICVDNNIYTGTR